MKLNDGFLSMIRDFHEPSAFCKPGTYVYIEGGGWDCAKIVAKGGSLTGNERRRRRHRVIIEPIKRSNSHK